MVRYHVDSIMSSHDAASTNRPQRSDRIVPLLLGKASHGIMARQMDEAHPEPRLFWLPALARRSGLGRRGSYRHPRIASAQGGLSPYPCRTTEPKSQTRTGLISPAQADLRVLAKCPGRSGAPTITGFTGGFRPTVPQFHQVVCTTENLHSPPSGVGLVYLNPEGQPGGFL